MDYLVYLLQRLADITSLHEGLTLIAVTMMGVGLGPLVDKDQRAEVLAWLRQYAAMLPAKAVLLLPVGMALWWVI
jgi:hypothetical protein